MESKRREGFDAVYRKYRDSILRTAFTQIHSREDAEDIAQEVFFRYYIYSAHSRVSSPGKWLAVTTRNLILNHVKHAKYERLLSEDEDFEVMMDQESDVADVFFDNMWKREIVVYTDRVLEVVKARNKRWYDALIYAYCMEMPRQKIADSMGISLDALASMLQRAKNWIRENCREEYDHIVRA